MSCDSYATRNVGENELRVLFPQTSDVNITTKFFKVKMFHQEASAEVIKLITTKSTEFPV